MELLRFTRTSNDGLSKVALSVCCALGLMGGIFGFAIWSVDPLIASAAFVIGSMFVVASIAKLRGLISPFLFEFVIEEDRLRFGRADQPDQQQVMFRSNIKCFILDADADASLCVDSGGMIAPLLAPGIILDASQMTEVAKVVSEHWSEVPVHDRETYQEFCRQGR